MKEYSTRDFFKKEDRSVMKYKSAARIVLVVLCLFFALQFFSHILRHTWESKQDVESPGPLSLSGLIFPFDAEPLFEYGYVLLKKHQQSPDDRTLEKSIAYFHKTLNRNMLYYHSHLYLGTAYHFKDTKYHASYDQAIASFKRAALVRGSHTRVGFDTMKMLLSLWPHLDEKDKTFCAGLLERSLRLMGREKFDSLLETWALYARDIDFFRDALKKRPQYYRDVAEKLQRLEIDMEARREFLLKYAEYEIENIQSHYRRYREESAPDLLERLKSLLNGLNSETTGYFLIDRENKLNQKAYLELKKRLNLDILERLFSKNGWKKDSKQLAEIETYILSHIEDLTSEELNAFSDSLEKIGYLDLAENNLRIFYVKQLVTFKSGQYDTVIQEIEELRKHQTYFTKESLQDYINIQLLLTDAYISFRLLLKAAENLKELEKIGPAVNLTEYYWRNMQIERVIGFAEEKDAQKQQEKEQQYELIRNSSSILMASTPTKRTVYLTDETEIEIDFSDWLKKRIQDYHLLKVTENGQIIHEAYLGNLKLPIKVKIPDAERYTRRTLTIKLL